MTVRGGLRLGAVLAATSLLVGCGAVVGTPSTGSASSSGEPPMDLYGAPHVAHPLNVEKFVKNPCSMISPAQLRELHTQHSLGTKAVNDKAPAARAGCRYQPADYNVNTNSGGVALLIGDAGLSALYSSRKSFTVFEPLVIEGFPSLNAVAKGESQSCDITVGAADRQAIAVEFDPSDLDAPRSTMCKAAVAMATAVVQTIKANQ